MDYHHRVVHREPLALQLAVFGSLVSLTGGWSIRKKDDSQNTAGFTEVAEMLHQIGRDGVLGYCFYHGQDLERAVCGEGLMLAFGDLEDTQDGKIEIGKIVANVMQANGFIFEWDQDPEKRISTGPFEWQRRYSG